MIRRHAAVLCVLLIGCSGTDDAGPVVDGTAPTPPRNLTATAQSSSSIQLAWLAATDNVSVVSYRVYRGGVQHHDTSDTSLTDTGLAASTQYCYAVSAFDGAGNESARTASSCVTTQGAGVPPAAPMAAVASALSSSSIRVTWTDASSNETGFKIERSLSSASGFTQVGTVGANIATYDSTGLTASTTYYFRVRANNAAGDSAYSNTASAITPPAGVPPAAPTGLAASASSSSSIRVSWTDASSNETGFKIERAPAPGTSFSQIAVAAANATSYDDTGRAPSTTYFYRIRSANAAGDSGYAGPVSATTPASGYTLAVAKTGTGSGTVTGGGINCGTTCSVQLVPGTAVTLTATPTAGAVSDVFGGWSGCDSASGTTCTVSMNGNRTVSAVFNEPAMTVEIYNLPATSSTGSYTVQWRCTGALCSTYTKLEEAPTTAFASPTPYWFYNSETSKAFTNKPDGTYCYRATKDTSNPLWSAPKCITVARPTTGVLRFVNNTRYDVIDLTVGGQQKLTYPYVILVGGSVDFTYSANATVSYSIGVGFYNANGTRDPWFIYTGSQAVTVGQVATVTLANPTLGQILTNFSSTRTWSGDYYCYTCDTLYHTKRFVFSSSGAYTQYNDSVVETTGTATLVSWSNYASVIQFRTCPTCAVIDLAYPFGEFLYQNGPTGWSNINYVRQ